VVEPESIEVQIEDEPEPEPYESEEEKVKPEFDDDRPPIRAPVAPPKVPGVLYERHDDPEPRHKTEGRALETLPPAERKAAVDRAVAETLAQLDPLAPRQVPHLGEHLHPAGEPEPDLPGAGGPDLALGTHGPAQPGLHATEPEPTPREKIADATEVHPDLHAPPGQQVTQVKRLPPGPKTPVLPPRVRDVIAQHRGAVRACFQKGLQLDPQLTGRVVVEFVIEVGGHVVSARSAQGTVMPDEAVTSCVVAILHGLQFPAAEDGDPLRVTYPFAFQSR
jgi:hypothetical protein